MSVSVPKLLRAGFLATLALSGPSLQAGDLEWRGFFTTGTSFTDSKVPYQGGINRKARVAEETFLGLNLSKDLTPEWRVAAQILARSTQADGAAKVDWAFATYEPASNYSITLGKQKIPVWMTSAYLDVGRAYPWVVPPEEVYTVFFSLKAFTGASAAYSIPLADSVFTIRPYGGDVVLETQPSSPDIDTKLRGTNLFGISAEWASGKSLLRAAYNRALWNINLGEQVQFGTRRYEIGTLGAKTEWAGFWMMAEYVVTKDNDEDKYQKLAIERDGELATATAAGDTAAIETLGAEARGYRRKIGGSHAYYGTLGRQMDSYFLHVTYANLERPTGLALSRDQSSFALGLNYDVNVDSVIKLEAKRVDVPGDSQGLFSARPEERVSMVYRIGYSMIF